MSKYHAMFDVSSSDPPGQQTKNEVTGSPPRSIPFTAGPPRLRSDGRSGPDEHRAPRLPLHSPRSCRRDYSAQRSQLDRGVHQNSGGDHPTHCEQWINAGRCPGGPVVHGHGGFRDADQPGLDPGGQRDRLRDHDQRRRLRGGLQPEQQLHKLRGHRLESQHHLQPRCGRLQRGRHDLGEFPERNHIIQTHRSLGPVFHGHGGFSDADQPGLDPGGRRDRLPGR